MFVYKYQKKELFKLNKIIKRQQYNKDDHVRLRNVLLMIVYHLKSSIYIIRYLTNIFS